MIIGRRVGCTGNGTHTDYSGGIVWYHAMHFRSIQARGRERGRKVIEEERGEEREGKEEEEREREGGRLEEREADEGFLLSK